MKIRIYITILSMIITAFCNAQTIERNVTASGGTSFVSANARIDFTVGECFTNNLSSQSNSITQGFHQPNIVVARIAENEKGETSNVKEEIHSNYHFDVYPNPATDYVNVKINPTSDSKFNLILMDETGKLIRNTELTDDITQIDFTQLAAGKYFITVTGEDGKQKETFKVLKLN